MKKYMATRFTTSAHEDPDGVPRPYDKGDIKEFSKPPPKGSHFTPVGVSTKMSEASQNELFSEGNEALLMKTKFKYGDLVEFAKTRYAHAMQNSKPKDKVVAEFIYARENYVVPPPSAPLAK